MSQFSNPAIADTVAAVFRSRAFAQRNTISIGEIVTEWVLNLIARFFGFAFRHPAVGFVIRALIAVAVAALVARIGYAVFRRYSPSISARSRIETSRSRDWWAVAQELAAREDYTAAAHALYLALLSSAARIGAVSLHDSKTTGDYLREVRRKPVTIDLRGFTDFTRSYETVIYGPGKCDRVRFLGLSALAHSILGGTQTRKAS